MWVSVVRDLPVARAVPDGAITCSMDTSKAYASMTSEPSVGAVPPVGQSEQPKLDLLTSRQFNAWLAEQQISLAFTTYQTGKLFLIPFTRSGCSGSTVVRYLPGLA